TWATFGLVSMSTISVFILVQNLHIDRDSVVYEVPNETICLDPLPRLPAKLIRILLKLFEFIFIEVVGEVAFFVVMEYDVVPRLCGKPELHNHPSNRTSGGRPRRSHLHNPREQAP